MFDLINGRAVFNVAGYKDYLYLGQRRKLLEGELNTIIFSKYDVHDGNVRLQTLLKGIA